MNGPPERERRPEYERLVEAFLKAVERLSTYEAGERSGLNPETVRRLRNGDWKKLQGGTAAKIKAYLARRGLLPAETAGVDPSSVGDLPHSPAEELIRSIRRCQEWGVFNHLPGDMSELAFARAVMRAAEEGGLDTREPAEMGKLVRWYADLLETMENPTTSRQESAPHDGPRRASAGSR